MQRNVEIKARIRNLEDIIGKAEQLSSSKGQLIKQDDVFFTVSQGRLKLRKYEDGTSELIYYDRPDCEGPKLSSYSTCKLPETSNILPVLNLALGMKGRVKKTRHLFIVGQTRVHIDHVEKLGDYMELEVILSENQTVEEGQAIADELMTQLGVSKEDLLSGAYVDHLKH